MRASLRQLAAMALIFITVLASPRVLAEPLERVRFRHYGVEDGLSQPTVRAMVQDRTGFVWIATQNGLNRFDGYEFKHFGADPADAHALADASITALARDLSDGVWVGTLAGGLSHFEASTGNLSTLRAETSDLASDAITALMQDAGGILWVGSGDGQLQRLNQQTLRFDTPVSIRPVVFGSIRAFAQLRDRALLVAGSAGLWRIDPVAGDAHEWRRADGSAINAWSMAQSDGGEVAVGTNGNGVLYFDARGNESAQRTQEDGLADSTVRSVLFDPDGRLWVGTNDGLSRLDRYGGEVRTWRFGSGSSGLSSSRVQSLMRDREGLLWVGTWLNGASLFDPRTEAIADLRTEPEDGVALPGSAVPALRTDTDGSVWLGVLESGGLVHFDMQRGVIGRYVSRGEEEGSLPGGVVQDVLRDRKGRLWIATAGGGVAWLDAGSDRFGVLRHDPDDSGSLPGNIVQRLMETRAGDLWVGTIETGLAMLCAGCQSFERYGGDVLGGTSVNALFEDSAGDVWIGLRPGGLVRYHPANGKFERWNARPGEPGALSHSAVSVVVEDSKSRIWVGTQGGGINRIELGPDRSVRSFESFAARDGLGADAVGGILEDAEGQLWVSTIAGLSRFDPESRTSVNFGTPEGAQSWGYFVGAFDRLPDGRMLFGGIRGVTVLDPERARKIEAPPPVVLTRAHVGEGDALSSAGFTRTQGSGSGTTGTLELSPGFNDLALEISALRYAAPMELQYSYRLDGIDTSWVDAGTRRRLALYSNLPSGDYVFRARARYREGRWGPELHVPVHLPAPWYQTPLSRTFFGIALLALFALPIILVRQRLRDRDRAQRELAFGEDRLREALAGSGDEVWDAYLSGDGRIERINPMTHLLPSAKGFPEGVDAFLTAVHPEDRVPFREALVAALKEGGGAFDMTYRVQTLDAGWAWIRSRARVRSRDAEGRALRIAGTSEDITALRDSQLELERLNVDLDRRVVERTAALTDANEQLRVTIDELHEAESQLVQSEKLAALGGLVAGVAHEINTPLGIGVTAASHLEQETERFQRAVEAGESDPKSIARYAQTAVESSQLILRNLQRADRLVRSFKQVAVDQVSEARRRIDLAMYLEEILLSLKPVLKTSGHILEIEAPPGIALETYPGAVYQVLSNLTVNAVQHAFEDGVRGTIKVSARQLERDAIVTFSDNGRGMDAECQRRLFEPFFTTRRGSGGSGLGMHIVWQLVTRVLGGRIECSSREGEGSTFTLILPLCAPLPPSGPASGL